ncbi:MAG TPA: response regulator, partial [Candidatus Cloacimonadota bacterium]|nr:response regulator [Candidatus Cloacimonadota bacterium]
MSETQTRILVVDDSLDMLTSLCKILELHSFLAEAAYNGSDALRKLDSAEYDLILCDIEMQGVTGLDLLERIRVNMERDLEVVLMTGFLEHEYYVRAIQLGAADFLAKPIDSKALIETITKVLSKRKKRKELSNYYKHLEKVSLSLEIKPSEFSKFSLSRVVYGYLNQNHSLPSKLINQVLSCLDEMAYNSFIHGTLNLNHDERTLDSEDLRGLIQSR